MRLPLSFVVAVMVMAGCTSTNERDEAPSDDAGGTMMMLTSEAFVDGATMPVVHTCDGANTSPPLRLLDIPVAASHVALVLGDPDAPFPEAPRTNYTHWTFWNAPLSGAATGLVIAADQAPPGAIEGNHDGGAAGYTGPCPPPASNPHRYVFTAYALAAPLDLAAGAARAEVDAALARADVIATASLTGLYQRQVVG